MIAQQTQNAFNDKMAQFTLISLGAAVGFTAESWAGLMIALPFVLFAPIAGWVSDRFSKRNVMLAAAVTQVVVLGWICGAVWMKNLPTALCGFFALATQSAFYSPAKIGSNKELVGSKHLGFAAGIQQMTAMLAILAGQIAAGWLFDRRFSGHGSTADAAWTAALVPLGILTLL
jgi:acyl-[acyl-carrier-protein]-phospholipid O-acyltransferase/long-chain-fatty-acid--[acyl-carrier-protein] ligase